MKKILITAPVHQDIKVFKEYLWSLNRLIIPDGYEVYKYFYLHNAGNLKKFLQPNEYEIINDNVKIEESNITHIWKPENFKAVCKMRTMALEKARNEKYDYVFTVDSDIILHSETLIDLLKANKDLISKAYWTAWDSNYPWLMMPNFYDYRDENEHVIYTHDLNAYKIMGTYVVGVTCGPLLISSKIFNNKLINYYPIKNLSSSYWEDYAFAVRCKAAFPDIDIYTNTIHLAKHLYRKEDYEKWINKEKALWK